MQGVTRPQKQDKEQPSIIEKEMVICFQASKSALEKMNCFDSWPASIFSSPAFETIALFHICLELLWPGGEMLCDPSLSRDRPSTKGKGSAQLTRSDS